MSSRGGLQEMAVNARGPYGLNAASAASKIQHIPSAPSWRSSKIDTEDCITRCRCTMHQHWQVGVLVYCVLFLSTAPLLPLPACCGARFSRENHFTILGG
ncbi:uncharacterized protein EI97DRAFT_177503 [Westerdykella ornata]|uniref:Uncharacterized protein n=1 Tax=Westerdykella ornata TaxID=318751 RepID=A0A6A6JT83_WESOR|nr:uncharacterized protein EI97DRAFT_177503 [Westerdykella ornata]KAF2279475.1 hypothetical protein EI97DRAFT_177503 [Westerdykella ornata]